MNAADLLASDLASTSDARRRAAYCVTEALAVLSLAGAQPLHAADLASLSAAIDVTAAVLIDDARAEHDACGERLLSRALLSRVEMLTAAATMARRALRVLCESRVTS